MASFVEVLQTAWSALQHSVSSFTDVLPLLVSLLAILPLLKPFFFPSRQSRALHNVPGPLSYPLVGNLVEFFRKGYHVCHLRWLLAYGPVFKYEMGKGNTVLTVAEPDLVQQVRGVDVMDNMSTMYSGPLVCVCTNGAPAAFIVSLVGVPVDTFCTIQ
jgi:hypothetical protein